MQWLQLAQQYSARTDYFQVRAIRCIDYHQDKNCDYHSYHSMKFCMDCYYLMKMKTYNTRDDLNIWFHKHPRMKPLCSQIPNNCYYKYILFWATYILVDHLLSFFFFLLLLILLSFCQQLISKSTWQKYQLDIPFLFLNQTVTHDSHQAIEKCGNLLLVLKIKGYWIFHGVL